MRLRTALAAAAALFTTCQAWAGDPLCGNLETMTGSFAEQGKQPFFVASSPNGMLTELHLSIDGLWTILEVYPNGIVCRVRSGDIIRFAPRVFILSPEQGT